MNAYSNRLPGLNGLRAIVAVSVVTAHIGIALQKFHLNPILNQNLYDERITWNRFGSNCVSIFFVLSGFLITWLLQTELRTFQKIDVKKFYLRRICRIWPLYYGYLIIAIAISIQFNTPLHLKSLLFYIFFTPNIPFVTGPRIALLSHYWSLGVEEQFYLFWPWVNRKTRLIVRLALIIIALFILTRLILHLFFPGSIFETFILVSRMQCMMIGALGAVFYKQENIQFLKLTNNRITQSLSWILLLLIAIKRLPFIGFFSPEIISVVSLCIIIGQIEATNRIINLDTQLLHFLGKISYGIYIFHPLVIFLLAKVLPHFTGHDTFNYLMLYGSVIIVTILLAWLSYIYFEKYFLRIKRRFELVTVAN